MAIFILDLIPAQPNLNGNTEESLLNQLRSLMDSLRDVSECLSGCSDHWHGRNFLPQGSAEAQLMRKMAENAWRLRMDAINSMHEEVLALALEIQGGSKQPAIAVVELASMLADPPAVIILDGWESVEGGARKDDGDDAA
jgi:hypothetical protein